jgi:hypothetical protein
MTSWTVAARLLPSGSWFARRLKVYATVALASACLFFIVAGWVADPSGNRMSAVISPVSAIVGTFAVIWLWRQSHSEKHQRHRL